MSKSLSDDVEETGRMQRSDNGSSTDHPVLFSEEREHLLGLNMSIVSVVLVDDNPCYVVMLWKNPLMFRLEGNFEGSRPPKCKVPSASMKGQAGIWK